MKKIITTVGTSLFTNFQRDEVKNKYGRDYPSISIENAFKNIENRNPNASIIYADDYKHYIQTIRENIEDYWFGDKYKDNKYASAEVTSILKIAEEDQTSMFEVHLIATDTLLSVLAAEMIVNWFGCHKSLVPNVKDVLFQRPPTIDFKDQKASVYVIKDLRVGNQADYEQGFLNLIEVLDNICDSNTILNITGGYKAIVPISTLYGQIKEIPVKYLYDESQLKEENELVTIGNLPLSFDWGMGELYFDYITKEGLKTIVNYPEILNSLHSIKILEPGTYRLTSLGKMFREYIKTFSDNKKSDLGYFVELKLFEHFSMNDYQVVRGRTFWWNIENPNLYALKPQFEKDADKELAIEIDLIITESNGDQIWFEVKSYSDNGLKKAKEQIEKRIQFWKRTDVKPPIRFHLLLYQLPGRNQIDRYRARLMEIAGLFQEETCQFKLEYFELPLSRNGRPSLKALSEQEITLHEFGLH